MKKIILSLLGVVFAFLFVACEEDRKDLALTTLSVSDEKVTPSYVSAVIQCALKSSATISEAYVQYAANRDFADSKKVAMTLENGQYSAELTDLQDSTLYYIRYEASNCYSTLITEYVSTFQTLVTNSPTITTTPAVDVTCTSATVGGNVTSDGGQSVTERGIVYSTTKNPTTSSNKKTSGSGLGSYSINLTGLADETTYYVRAYAINNKGTAYGEEVSFKTTAYSIPTVTTSSATNITGTSATIGGNVTSDGGQPVTERGIVYSTTKNPTTSSNKITRGTGTGSYSINLTGLADGTTYYVRAYAINNRGTAYGEEVSFKTTTYGVPTVTTSSATNITGTSATIGGNVTSDGGQPVTERGIVYSTTKNPTTSSNKKTSGSGLGSYSIDLTGLADGTTYYVRAYAINSKGTAYGEEVSFKTTVYGVPTVRTSSATNITSTSATVGGNVTNTGGQPVTERGIVYSTTKNPTTSSNKMTSGAGLGSYSINLTGLADGTTYYVRAYAINNKGTAYGEEVSFKTTTVPTITTSSATNITSTSATVGGNVTSDGGQPVTERGIVYSTTPNPTTSSNKMTSGAGLGSYSINLTGLSEGTTYYVRAYAINSNGTAYGEEIHFKTTISSAKVRFQMMDMYSITAMYLLDAGNNVLAEYYDLLKLSSYFKIPSGNAYPVMRDFDGNLYYMLDNPYYYYFESGCYYTVQLTDDGTYLVCNVIKDGTFNLPAKVVATYKVHKNELRMQKKVKTE